MLQGLNYRWTVLMHQLEWRSGLMVRRHRNHPNRAVLMFHSILPRTEPTLHLRNNSVDQLLEIVAYLQKVGEILPLEAWMNSNGQGEFALTFDDGLLNNLTHAAPRLADLRVPATYFVNSPLVIGQEHIWPELVSQYTQGFTGELHVGNQRFKGAAHNRWFEVDSKRGLIDCLMQLTQLDLQDALTQLATQTGHKTLSTAQRVMNANELRILSQLDEASIGGHGVDHRAMTLLNDAELRSTLLENKKYIEEAIGKNIHALAFPFGRADHRVCKAAIELGYRHLIGVNEMEELPQVVRRFGFYNHENLASQLKALSAY